MNTIKLSNDMKITYINVEHTNICTIILKVFSGAINETLYENGITHLIEHLMFRRCDGMSQKEFYYEIEKMGGTLNACTYQNYVLFEITVNSKYFKSAIDLIRKMYNDNKWSNEDIKKEKEVVYRQIENSNNYLSKTLKYNYFNGKHTNGNIMATESKVRRLSKRRLIEVKKELFASNNTQIIISKSIKEHEKKYCEHIFSDVKKSRKILSYNIKPKGFSNRTYKDDVLYIDESEYSSIGIIIDLDTNKIPISHCEIIYQTLARGLISPLYLKLREELGLLEYIESNTEYFEFGGYMYFIFTTKKENILLLLNSVLEIFIEQRNKIDEKALECTMKFFIDGNENLYENTNLSANIIAFNNLDSVDEYMKQFKNIDDIQNYVKEMLSSKNLLFTFNDIEENDEIINEIYLTKNIFRTKIGD